MNTRAFLFLVVTAFAVFEVTWSQNCSDIVLDIIRSSCPPEASIDTVQCECNCSGIQCPPLAIQSPFDCSCLCLVPEPNCSAGEVFSRPQCACISAPNCSDANRNCSSEQIFSLEQCACVDHCNLTCAFPMRRHDDECSCVCEGVGQSKCPPPFLYNNETCFCECPQQLTCTAPQEFSNSTCECQCPIVPNCPSGSFFNTSACACQPLCGGVVCPLGQVVVDYDLCSCGCVAVETCNTPGMFFSNDSCSCRCESLPDCPYGLEVDDSTCGCVCPHSTSRVCCDGKAFNDTTCSCRCTGETDCPAGFVYSQEECSCVCAAAASEAAWVEASKSCYRDSNKIFNLFACGCECPPFVPCSAGKTMDPGTCQCRCPDRKCPAHKVHNDHSCECECPFRKYCNKQAGQSFSLDSCSCQCDQAEVPCGFNHRRNPSTCACECAALFTACPKAGYAFDHASCGCVCQPRSCPLGQRFNAATCACEALPCGRTCPPGQFLYAPTCSCKCASVRRCYAHQHWDANRCGCVYTTVASKPPPPTTTAAPPTSSTTKPPSPVGCQLEGACPGVRVWSPDICGCICPISRCPVGKTLDHASCECRCPGDCQPGMVRSGDSCECKPYSSASPRQQCQSKRTYEDCMASSNLPCYWSGECKVHCCVPHSNSSPHTASGLSRCLGISESACRYHSSICKWIC